jgi:hypothetical protein
VSRRSVILALCVTAAGAAAAGVGLPVDPWLGFGAAAVLAGAAAVVASVAGPVRNLVVAFTATVLGLLAVESIFAIHAALEPSERYSGNYATADYWNADDPVLGYGPRAGAIGTSTKILDGREVYRAIYTIDDDALRRTAPAGWTPHGGNCLLFFGDSFTFGEGLDDDASLPWLARDGAGPAWRSYNFGFHGYGPHQMLAAIEAGRVAKTAGACTDRVVVVLQFSEQHAGRALGRASWDTDGPWYVLDADGRVRLSGRFDERPKREPILSGRYRPEFLKWLDWRRLFWVTDIDRRFFVGLLTTAHDRLAATFPAAEWHLILLDERPNPLVTTPLERHGISVHPIQSIVPGWRPDHPDYSIPGDGHPNRRYNSALAAWLAAGIVQRPPVPIGRSHNRP